MEHLLELPENISARRLQRVLEYGAEDFKVSFIVVKIEGLTIDNVIATLATIHACNEFCDILTYSPLLVSQRIVFSI